jgi:hypothetical protein
MPPGRIELAVGNRLVLLITVVHVQCAYGKDGTANVVLIVGIVCCIFLMTLTFVTVNIVYYHCVHKKSLAEDAAPIEDKPDRPASKKEGGESEKATDRANNDPEVIGETKLAVGASHLDASDTARQGLNFDFRAGQGVSIVPEAGGVGELTDGTSADVAQLRARAPQHQLKPGIAKLTNAPSKDSMLSGSEVHGPASRCCAVWDWCSPGATKEGGLPPAVATAVEGPPNEPRPPASMPRGKLQL